MTDQPTERESVVYDAIDAFQRTHRLPGLQHAQIRGLLAEHLARVLPAAFADLEPVVPVSSPPPDQTLRDRIAEAVQDGPTWMLPRSLAEEVADAVLAVLPPPADRATVCICGHTDPQHFEDACLVCDCGDYLVPEAAREVIARWRAAAGKAERIRENADFHLGQEMARRQLAEKEADRLSADRAAVLRDEAALIRAHCPDHLDSNSADGSWINCHCAVADDMERRLAAEAQPECPACGHLTCMGGEPCGVISTERGELAEPCGCMAAEAQPELEADPQLVSEEFLEHLATAKVREDDGAEAPQADTETRVPAEDPARVDRLRPEFTEHASIEAIDAQLRRARAQERRWHLRTEWLISLRADRVAQKERGEWPDAAPAAAGPGRAADTQDDEEA